MIHAFASDAALDHVGLYGQFLERESDQSGTVVLHHGLVKRPGKQVPHFSRVRLEALCDDPGSRLLGIARAAAERFGLNQALVAHRLGTVKGGDTVLIAIVSARARDASFQACAWIVDEVKKEEIIRLVEEA